MLHTVTTMISLMLSAGALGVIAFVLIEDRQALRQALRGTAIRMESTLPSRTHRIAGARRARFIQLSPSRLRAAA